MPRNIEWKARLSNFMKAMERAGALAARPHFVEKQRDIYFSVPEGRLKCRERWIPRILVWERPAAFERRLPAELIGYRRPNGAGPRGSDYRMLEIDDPESLIRTLDLALGTRAVVEKTRWVALVDNVRIHLDDVRDLGSFLEFEAIVEGDTDDAAAHEKIARLREYFGLGDEAAVSLSYGDLVAG